MIYDASTFPGETTLHADLCVVGSGAGGSMAAMVAAEAGLKVVLLEAGELVLPETMNQREEQMLPRLLWESGGLTTDDRAVRIHQGRAVGGSTVHNLNLCKRAPEPVLAEWARTRGLAELGTERWRDLYGRVEALLEVSDLSPEDWNRHNQLLATGCDALGWRWGSGRHNRMQRVGLLRGRLRIRRQEQLAEDAPSPISGGRRRDRHPLPGVAHRGGAGAGHRGRGGRARGVRRSPGSAGVGVDGPRLRGGFGDRHGGPVVALQTRPPG